ncbi:MAG: glycosyltransferase family 2 protein [bacterium]|nr:glycosyltransferase family 2 protein [bacterium]
MPSPDKHRIAVVIPCYNAGALCQPVFEAARTVGALVIGIDDGSTDDTAQELASAGITVLTHPRNQGKGAALRTGFHWLLQQEGWEVCATLDADGQHDPTTLPQIAAPVLQGATDLAIGTRQFDRATMPFSRWIANTLSSFLISKLMHASIQDIQCGYRVYSRRLLQQITPPLQSTGFEIETEMLLLALKHRARIAQLPIPSVYQESSSQVSSWRALRDSARIARTVYRLWNS